MSVYSNLQIRQAIKEGTIVCHPFRQEYLNRTSLDVTLGYYYYRVSGQYNKPIYDLFSKEEVERYFDGPHRALTYEEWCSTNGHEPVDTIPLDHPVISIEPKERILVHTHEFLGVLSPGVAEVRSRANWRLNGVITLDSGWIEPNSISRYMLTLYNSNEQETIPLPVGERIAQVVFLYASKVKEDENQITSPSGWKTDLDTVIKAWSPYLLLPRAYKIERKLPPQF